MSCWNKEQLDNMLEDVVNEHDLSDLMIEEHGQKGIARLNLLDLCLNKKTSRLKC